VSGAAVTPSIVCAICGKSLAGHYGNAKTCGPACRVKLHRRRKRANAFVFTAESRRLLREAISRSRLQQLERAGGFDVVEHDEKRHERGRAA
jgi:predicted nucleic acid-binding Zn ribbon protein